MGLNDIKFPPAAIASLYRHSLIESTDLQNEVEVKTQTGKPPNPSNEIETANRVPDSEAISISKFFGENNKNVLVVIRSSEKSKLPAKEESFLKSILKACQLEPDDVMVVPFGENLSTSKNLVRELQSRAVLLFDIPPADFGLPISFPEFQVQSFGDAVFLYCPSLKEIINDSLLKSKLWVSLKRVFDL